MINHIRTHIFSKQFLRFVTIGFFVTAIDFVIYIFLTRLFSWWEEHFLLANALSFLIAVIISYFMNKKWTFEHTGDNHALLYSQFFFVSLTALILNQFILWSLAGYLGFFDIIAKVVSTGTVVLYRHYLYKFWVFQ